MRFTRADRVHLELPGRPADVKPGRAACSIATASRWRVPVTVGERTDGTQRWITADLALAPLAPGDYAVEIRIVGPQANPGSSPPCGSPDSAGQGGTEVLCPRAYRA